MFASPIWVKGSKDLIPGAGIKCAVDIQINPRGKQQLVVELQKSSEDTFALLKTRLTNLAAFHWQVVFGSRWTSQILIGFEAISMLNESANNEFAIELKANKSIIDLMEKQQKAKAARSQSDLEKLPLDFDSILPLPEKWMKE